LPFAETPELDGIVALCKLSVVEFAQLPLDNANRPPVTDDVMEGQHEDCPLTRHESATEQWSFVEPGREFLSFLYGIVKGVREIFGRCYETP
jgi:hypothetical protein